MEKILDKKFRQKVRVKICYTSRNDKYHILLFRYVCKQTLRISQKVKKSFNLKPLGCYFCVKTKISVDFHICISVLLNNKKKKYVEIGPNSFELLDGVESDLEDGTDELMNNSDI